MKIRVVADVSNLPTYGHGPQSGPWWGSLGFMALEGMGFALAIATYYYLYAVNPHWPQGAPPPDLWPGTALSLVLLLSVIPNIWTKRVALAEDLDKTRIGLLVMSAIGVVAVVLRAFEFAHTRVWWDASAYGSIVWFVLGLHTTHIATDLGETIVLAALMFTRHGRGRRFSDVTDNCFYWNFVVITWIPLYVMLDWTPRL
jgi:cytochrome c oxidase subunit 3